MNFSQQIPKPVALGAIAVAVLVSVALAWVQLTRVPEPTAEDLKAKWVELADDVRDLRKRGRQAEALRAATMSVALAERAYGPTHPAMAEALNELAQLRIAAADYTGVGEMLEQAITIQARVTGPESPEVASTVMNLAQAMEKQGDFPAARTAYDRALAMYEKTVGSEHQLTALEEVQPRPVEPLEVEGHQRREVGRVGDQIALALEQALRLAQQLFVDLVGLVPGPSLMESSHLVAFPC